MAEKNIYDKITLESGVYQTTLNRSFLARKPWVKLNPREIRSFMPGAAVEMRVAVGDKVKRGQSLMLFKAMKMNNNILSPVDGKVKTINVKIGENIPKNVVMIELE